MFLSREEMFDRSLGGINREHEMTHWCGNIIYVVVNAILKLCFRYSVTNLEIVRSFMGKRGAIIASNHTSYLDVAFLWCAIRPSQWVRLIARENLFDTCGGFGGQLIARVGAFPIKRDSADRTALKRAARMLKNGELVGIFPEGTRRGKGSKESELHAGVALIAKMGKAPIIPATIRDAENIKRKGQMLRFPKVSIEFGAPVYLEDFEELPKADRLDACSWFVMRECFALSQRIPASEVDMGALFPHAKDYSAVVDALPMTMRSQSAEGILGPGGE